MTGVVVVRKNSVLIVTGSNQVVVVKEAVSRVISAGVRLVQNIFPNGGSAYEHSQTAPVSEWIINHNLGYRPAIEILDAGGNEIDAQVLHISLNQARIYFTLPAAGSARCN